MLLKLTLLTDSEILTAKKVPGSSMGIIRRRWFLVEAMP